MKSIAFRLIVVLVALGLGGLVLIESLRLMPGQPTGEPATLLDRETVRAHLVASGYAVDSLVLDGALYEVRLSDGGRLYVDATDGEVVDLPKRTGPAISIQQVGETLEAEGYRLSGSIVWQRGFFVATVSDRDDQAYKLRIDPFSGEIVERTPL